jgi:hypothetical protein
MYGIHPTTVSQIARLRGEEILRRAREDALARSVAPPGRLRRRAARTLVRAAARLDREVVRRAST